MKNRLQSGQRLLIILFTPILAALVGCDSRSSNPQTSKDMKDPIALSSEARLILSEHLQLMAEEDVKEIHFSAYFITDSALQRELNTEVKKGSDVAEVSKELFQKYPPNYGRIGFGVGGYMKESVAKDHHHKILGYNVIIFPSCLKLLEGRTLIVDTEGNLVADPPPPAEFARQLLEKSKP